MGMKQLQCFASNALTETLSDTTRRSGLFNAKYIQVPLLGYKHQKQDFSLQVS